MTVKTCKKCGKEYPATTEYFHKNSQRADKLQTFCKNCSSVLLAEKKRRIPQSCEGCQKLKGGKCMVMIRCFKECWAYTTDKDWLQKVKQAVKEYTKK